MSSTLENSRNTGKTKLEAGSKKPELGLLGVLILAFGFYGGCRSAGDSSAGPVLIVSYSGAHQMGLFDGETYQPIAVLPTIGKGPHEIAVSPDGRHAYVALSGTGPGGDPGRSVNVVDLRAKTVRSFEDGMCSMPHDVRVSGAGDRIWVACAPDRAVLELDAKTGRVVRSWDTGVDGGWFVETSREGNKIFVPHLEGKSFTILDRRDGSRKSLPFPSSLGGVAISPDGREVWTMFRQDDREHVAIIDTATDQVLTDFPVGTDGAGRLAFTPDGKLVVLSMNREAAVVDAGTREVVSRVPLPAPTKVVTVSADGTRAFLTSPPTDQVFVVDIAKAIHAATIPTGKTPDGVAWAQPK